MIKTGRDTTPQIGEAMAKLRILPAVACFIAFAGGCSTGPHVGCAAVNRSGVVRFTLPTDIASRYRPATIRVCLDKRCTQHHVDTSRNIELVVSTMGITNTIRHTVSTRISSSKSGRVQYDHHLDVSLDEHRSCDQVYRSAVIMITSSGMRKIS